MDDVPVVLMLPRDVVDVVRSILEGVGLPSSGGFVGLYLRGAVLREISRGLPLDTDFGAAHWSRSL